MLGRLKQQLRGTVVHRAYHAAREQWQAWEDRRPTTDISEMNARYDRQTIAVMRRVLGPDSLCVDVGAHDGSLLEKMFAFAPNARHLAIEPLPHLAEQLHSAFPNARVHDCALGDTRASASFQYVENDPGYSGLRRRVYDRPDPIVRELSVRVERLDDLVPSTERLAFLKVDVEGGEYHVLRGALETIRRGRPIIVFEAGEKSTGQYGVTAREMYTLVTDTLGYSLTTMHRWLTGGPPLTADQYHWGPESDFYFLAAPRAAS